MMDFKVFKTAVAAQFKKMHVYAQEKTGGLLYRTEVEKDTLWDTYLQSFPEGTNPMFRERTEHDCSCCRSFIKAVGNVVAVTDSGLESIWDINIGDVAAKTGEWAYQAVADAMSKLVKSRAIENVFLTTERTAGTDKNFEDIVGGKPIEWSHFYLNIPDNYVVRGADIGTKLSHTRAEHDVLKRSLDELTDDAIMTTVDLIAQNSLYRGEENKSAVSKFYVLKKEYDKVKDEYKDAYVWRMIKQVSPAVSKIRNTSIGTLITDLSNGVDLEEAVRKYEAMVAPQNYRRPTALVTPAMVEKAKAKVEELGLTSALGRRYATITDISVNDILFADRTAKKNLAGNVFDDLAASVADKKPRNLDKIEEIPIEKFIKDVLPQATTLEIMFENRHIPNLVSLIAPIDPTAGRLFKWNNNFSWAYKGDVADSLKEKVKAAGGNVTGDLCCRLAWYNYDDLDLHMKEPNGDEIYFASHTYRHKSFSKSGGQLDVDMNAGQGATRTPVENIYYANKAKMKEGIYTLFVHQYHRRENENVGFEAEIDFMGEVYHFSYDKRVEGNVVIAKFSYSHKDGIKLIESLPTASKTKEVWGLTTNKYHKVNLMMYSPNHWESTGTGVGNKHYMFMLGGCINPEPARGFFNEYLDARLNEHRKVFELVGTKCKAEFTENQLSGLGFSSTQHTDVLCKVGGSFNRIVKIVI